MSTMALGEKVTALQELADAIDVVYRQVVNLVIDGKDSEAVSLCVEKCMELEEALLKKWASILEEQGVKPNIEKVRKIQEQRCRNSCNDFVSGLREHRQDLANDHALRRFVVYKERTRQILVLTLKLLSLYEIRDCKLASLTREEAEKLGIPIIGAEYVRETPSPVTNSIGVALLEIVRDLVDALIRQTTSLKEQELLSLIQLYITQFLNTFGICALQAVYELMKR